MKRILAGLIAVGALSAVVYADEGKSDSGKPPVFGQLTGDWVRLQASNKQGSQNVQDASPVVQEKAVKRYLDSFEYRIPEYLYNRNTFSSGGGSSAGSSR